MSDEVRFERIEKKLDGIQETLTNMARIEERIVTMFNRQANLEERVSLTEKAITAIHLQELPPIREKVNSRFAERIFWLILVALIGAVASLIR